MWIYKFKDKIGDLEIINILPICRSYQTVWINQNEYPKASMNKKYRRMIRIMLQILKKMHIPLYLHPKSKHTFSIHQHIVLVLRQYESKSYESMIEWLEVATEIVHMLGLKEIPHFTTMQKVAARLSDILLHVAIGRFIGLVCPGKIFAGIDATGFETRHAYD